MISAKEAIDRLKEGNKRFVSGSPLLESLANPERCNEFASGQEPFAIILGVPTRVCRRAVWSAFGCSSQDQNCGAVAAIIKELKRPTENRSPNLGTIADRIRPAVEPLISTSVNDATLL